MASLPVLHPFLFVTFRILALFSHNIETVSPVEAFKPLSVGLVCVGAVWLALNFFLKNSRKTGLVISVWLAVFFFFSPISDALYPLNKTGLMGPVPIHMALAIVVLVAPASRATVSILKTRDELRNITTFLNVMSIVAVAMPTANIAYRVAFSGRRYEPAEIVEFVPPQVDSPVDTPDIYYVVLDGYARADTLRDFFDYDNTEFLKHLSEKGFYIADKSISNYCQTYPSLASSLNFTYLDGIRDRLGRESKDRRPLKNMIVRSKVAAFLKQQGYTFVAFASGYTGTEIPTADVYLKPEKTVTELQHILKETTPLASSLSKSSQHDAHRNRNLFMLDRLADMSDIESPKFVFAHIVAPHPPFVFAADGSPVTPDWKFTFADGNAFMRYGSREQYIKGYTGQLEFISSKVKEMVTSILSRSPQSIIIMQGDHGSGSMLDWRSVEKTNVRERHAIFNAYYLPTGGYEHLYPEISPVNTFRVVFNHYFGTDYELLEDKAFFSIWNRPYEFVEVTNEVKRK